MRDAIERGARLPGEEHMANTAFDCLQVLRAQTDFVELHERVLRHKGRIQIDCDTGSCVLISKDELDTLERALEIFADSDCVQQLCTALSQLAAQTGTTPSQQQ